MNKKFFTGLIIVMGLSILGIIVVQMVWINNAIRVKNELFNGSVNEALGNTVSKLEEIHNREVVNRLVFADSLRWSGNKNVNFKVLPVSPARNPDSLIRRPRRPVHVIREFNPQNKNTRIEIKLDSSNKKGTNVYSFEYNISTGSNKNTPDNRNQDRNNVFIIQKDTIITDVDSLFKIGEVKIDSIISGLDTLQVISSDISKRVETKAINLKRTASQVANEIISWDVQTIDSALIKKVLTEELINKDIPIDFEFGILKDSVFIDKNTGIKDSLKLLNTEYRMNLYPHDIIQKNLKLAVFFPERDSFILRSINWLLALSLFFSLFILITFGLSIFYIIRQKRISEMKSDFINNMTHEFKTPIATISVASDSITNEKVLKNPDQIRFFAGMIKKENSRMNRQVEDILTIARLDKKEFNFKWEKIDIHELINDAIQGIILQIENRDGNIKTELNAENPVVTTDKIHCTNIIYNLLDNANKYSVDKPEIKVTTQNKTNGVLISVEDNGIGMHNSVQTKIFERFYRQTSGNVHNVKGFGLGLSYVKAVAEANRGNIKVESEPGKGSRFDLFIPFIIE